MPTLIPVSSRVHLYNTYTNIRKIETIEPQFHRCTTTPIHKYTNLYTTR
ncbi:MAG TPA: hypothetical protein VFF15_05860 [Flavobacteriaceae bacterium]|nr:hypothetical protein [Flavobacteriaceae bacterium]